MRPTILIETIKRIINHYLVSRLVPVSAARCGPSWLYNECWLFVKEVLALDRTSGDLVLRETKEQRNFPSHLAPAHPSTDCPCIEPSVVWFEFSSDVPDSFGVFVQTRTDAIRAVSVCQRRVWELLTAGM
jgi:hypothetical protein